MPDISNKFFIGIQGDDIVFLRPIPQRLSKEDAIVLAAWLVVLADTDNNFGLVIEQVQNAG